MFIEIANESLVDTTSFISIYEMLYHLNIYESNQLKKVNA